ncbi:FixH family protein [Hyphomonas sp.]|jgi:nitrogen fixation protein FixH|uniref:FixH family protein n=1 Tax=Hyphomonas sp. TaxID=87 RepID=UPI0039E5C1C7
MMPTLSPPLETDEKVLKGHHVLFWLIGFFGLMFIVNGVFLWAALSSFPGEDVRHSYLQGLHFNQTIASLKHQEGMAWKAELGLIEEPDGDVLVARILDADGLALPSRNVTAELRRAATQDSDIIVDMLPVGSGEYRAELPVLTRGAWHVALNAEVADGRSDTGFKASKVIMVK